jgi:hypothetical protein
MELMPIICPKCKVQVSQTGVFTAGQVTLFCKACNTKVVSFLFTIRAKRSRRFESFLPKREFNIRVIDAVGKEHLKSFGNVDSVDFELRARDQAIFTYSGGELAMIQNLTIDRSYEVRAPLTFGSVGTAVSIAIILAIAALLRWLHT